MAAQTVTENPAGIRSREPERKDLRQFLRDLVTEDPDQVVVVNRPVDPEFEATAIVDRMRTDPGYEQYPAVLFTNIEGSDIPLLINLCGTYDRLARSIGATVQTMVEEFARRERDAVPTVAFEGDDAPVHEIVWTGDDADLGRLPLLRHQELDAGKYVTSAVSITRDPDTGVQNGGIFRAEVHGSHELGFQAGAHQDTAFIFRKYRQRGETMPIALVIGHHPGLILAGTTNPPGLGGELEVAGGLMGEPLELVQAKTVDLQVPARAEIVIEGMVDPDPATYREEGPFGEYPRYYTGVGVQPVILVTAITMRRQPIYMDVFNASPEHLAIGGLARTGFLLSRIRDVCPSVTNLHLPISGTARMHAYISMNKRSDGEPHTAAFIVFANSPATKHVWIVDDDIDVTNEAEVLWAFSTRFQADKDMVVINNSVGSRLNPPTYAYHRDEKGQLESKLIFDCTRPLDLDFPEPTRIPPDVKSRMDPAAYIRPFSGSGVSF